MRLWARCGLSLIPIGYALFIWILSSFPADAIIDTGLPFEGLFKESLHFIEFGLLYFLLILASAAWGWNNSSIRMILAAAASFYGFVDEVHQYFVPARTASAFDLMKDILGVWAFWCWSNGPNGTSFLGKVSLYFNQTNQPNGSKHNEKSKAP